MVYESVKEVPERILLVYVCLWAPAELNARTLFVTSTVVDFPDTLGDVERRAADK